MNGVISGRVVVIDVASVVIGEVVTCEDGLGDEKSMTGSITGGVDVTEILPPCAQGLVPARNTCTFPESDQSGLHVMGSGSGPAQSLMSLSQGLIEPVLLINASVPLLFRSESVVKES
ncbi:hypothetical protein Tco_1132344 [Tanacetum coccineum]|uniref:Uncharacterized protein n=1 Tax=Tanacetum coccineum TaxID=301880 RepID=A0ABQ5JEP4_9ASTR